MKKLALFPVLLLFSCALAGLYGMLHNQISYTVSPAYFHEFKFIQFRIEPEQQNRLGAAIVGFQASWWMGLIIGLPIYLAAVFVPRIRPFLRVFCTAALLVVSVTLFTGLAALAVAGLSLSEQSLPLWMRGRNVTTPLAFARAGMMHNYSYLGGLIGLIVGAGYVIWHAVALRRLS